MKRLVFLICLAACSCTAVLKTAYGIKDPKIEQKNDVREFVLKNRLDTTNVVFFKSLLSFAAASKKNYLNIPDAIFFNSRGEFVDYNKSASDCNAGVDAFLSDLNEFDKRTPDSLRTQTELHNFLDIDRAPDNHAITVYITFARYTGKLNRDKAFTWVGLIEKARQNGIDINYYLVNCDYLENWNIPPTLYKSLGIKS